MIVAVCDHKTVNDDDKIGLLRKLPLSCDTRT